MSIDQKIQEQEDLSKERKKVVDLKLLPGGKGPYDSSDWLSNLELGTIFLVQHKNNPMEFSLGLFHLVEKTNKAVILMTKGAPVPIYVNPIRFCNVFSLFEIVGVLDKDKESTLEKETKDITNIEE